MVTPGVYFLDFFFFSASGAHDFEKLADLDVFRQCSKFFRRELVPALRAIGIVEFSEKFGAQVNDFAHGKKEADRPQESYEGATAKLRSDCSENVGIEENQRESSPYDLYDFLALPCQNHFLEVYRMSCRSFSRLQKKLSVTIFPKRICGCRSRGAGPCAAYCSILLKLIRGP